jgi:hypothetical protein
MVRAARAMAMVMRVAGNKEGNGKGRKGNDNRNKVCRSKIELCGSLEDGKHSIDSNIV